MLIMLVLYIMFSGLKKIQKKNEIKETEREVDFGV